MIKNSREILPFLFILLFLGSCTDFFSTSWASWAARDPSKLIPDVTVGNVNELIEKAENDPALSLEVLKKIAKAVNNSSGKNKAVLQAAAVEAAVNAVGLGQTMLSVSGELYNIINDEDAATAATKKAIKNMPNLEETSSTLYNTLPKNPASKEFDNFVNTASAEDIAMAAIVLYAGAAREHPAGIDDYVDNFDSDPDTNPSDEATLALHLADALEHRQDELPESLRSILNGLNLWKNT